MCDCFVISEHVRTLHCHLMFSEKAISGFQHEGSFSSPRITLEYRGTGGHENVDRNTSIVATYL